VPIVGTRMQESELLMPDHAPSSIPTYSPTPTLAPPVVSPPPPGPTEFDSSGILDLVVRGAAERAVAKAMKVWEGSVKYYEETVKDWEKRLKRTSGRNAKRQKKEEKKSATQDDSGVVRLQREREIIE